MITMMDIDEVKTINIKYLVNNNMLIIRTSHDTNRVIENDNIKSIMNNNEMIEHLIKKSLKLDFIKIIINISNMGVII